MNLAKTATFSQCRSVRASSVRRKMRGAKTDHNAGVGPVVEHSEQDVHDWILAHDSVQPGCVDRLHVPERDVSLAEDGEGERYGLEALSAKATS